MDFKRIKKNWVMPKKTQADENDAENPGFENGIH